MSLQRSEHIRPLKMALRTAKFVQVLVTEFTLTTHREGATLELGFDDDTLAVTSVDGKDDLRRQLGIASSRGPSYQSQIDAFLAGSASSSYRFSDPGFAFRYASGGILPIIRLGDRDYYALFWRDIFPIGWNIANGGSESRPEMIEPLRTIDREFREELVIMAPEAHRRYAYPRLRGIDEPGTLPVALALWEDRFRDTWQISETWELSTKWIHGPDSVLVTYAGREPLLSSGYFLNINTEDYGIEVDRVARIRLEEKAVLLDGEICGNDLLNQPVGLFDTDRMDRLVRSGATDFRPDRFFFDGRSCKVPDLESVVKQEYLRYTAGFRSSDQGQELESQPNWFNLCPVTRQIISRYLAWEERVAAQAPSPPARRPYEGFLCFKHEDLALARRLYNFLTERGLAVFFSTESIDTDVFSEAIYQALNDAEWLVVVGTRLENIAAPWPRFEWNSFHHDVLSGVKPNGRMFSLVTPDVDPRRLPYPLRTREATVYDEKDPELALDRVYRLVAAA